MRLLLVLPPLVYGDRWTRTRTAHLIYLFSWVRRHNPNVSVSVLDYGHEVGSLEGAGDIARFGAAFRNRLAAERPDVVGVSCWTSLHFTGALEVARLVKAHSPALPVIVGGYHATALPEDFADPPGLFDYVVRGEGEVALSAILRAGAVPHPEGPEVIDGPPVPIEEEELLFDEYPYHTEGSYVLFLSRGCPFRCQFCVEPEITSLRGRSWRRYSWTKTERLVRDLVERRGARHLGLHDALLGASRTYRHRLWELLASFGEPPTTWGETRVDLLDETDYRYLAQLPIGLDVGLDAITPESVERMQKSPDPGRYLQSFHRYVDAMARHGKYVRAYLILNYPGETLETLGATVGEVERTVERVRRAHGKSNLFVGAQSYQLFPGTPDYLRRGDLATRYGTRFPNDGWWRVAAPRPEVRAAAYLPSEAMLRAGGLGAAESAKEYIRTVCRKHGLPAVYHHYGDREVPPRRLTGATFEYLLTGAPARFHRLRAVVADLATVHAAGNGQPAYFFNAALAYSSKVDPVSLARLRSLLAAPTVKEGLATLPGGTEEQAAAFRSLVTLLERGFLDLRLPPTPEGPAATAYDLAVGGATVSLEAVDGDAARFLAALSASGFLADLPAAVSWTGVFTAFCVPAPLEPLRDGERGTPRPAERPVGLYLGAASDGTWPLLALATAGDLLPEDRAWRLLARPQEPWPSGLSVGTRIGSFVPGDGPP